MKYIVLIILSFLILAGCQKKDEKDFIDALIQLDDSVYAHQEIDPEIRNEIEQIVDLFKNTLEAEVERNEDLGLYYKRLGEKYLELAQIYHAIQERFNPDNPEFTSSREEGIYTKMLAIRYFDNKMYGNAYESFNRAIKLDPGNALLFYYTGVCAGWIAKSYVEPDSEKEQEKWYLASESSYKRALELDPYLVEALYGYAILLIIELDRPEEGIPYAKKILEKETKNINSLFLLARAYYRIGEYEQSLDYYDRILDITTSDEVKERVRILKEQVKDTYYDTE